MAAVFAVILLALIEYQIFGALVGRARIRHGVVAPATTGPAPFERAFRVQQNTLENLVVFVPAVWIFGSIVSAPWAAAIGLVFIAGRAIYARAYLADPATRRSGALISFAANGVLLVGGLLGAVWAWI